MAPPYLAEENERRRKALNIQRSLQKETARRNFDNDTSGSDGADVDFTVEIHPISHFIDDREKMIEEMFSILKGEKLQRILPAMLKDYTIEELKADCLVHLLGMSKKRIFAILEGRDLKSSSDSEADDEHAADEQPRSRLKSNSPEVRVSTTETSTTRRSQEKLQSRPRKRKTSGKDDKKPNASNSPFIIISDDELEDVKPLREERKTILKLRKERRSLKAKIEKKMKKTEKRKMKTLMLQSEVQTIVNSSDEQDAAKSEDSDDDDEDTNEDKGKSLLEILELEMRARAIRALLKNTTNYEEPVPVSILNIKPEPNLKVETEINKTIAEVMNEESSVRDLSSPTDDIEISEVCDVLTVTIDDDDDEIEPTPTPMPIHNRKQEEREVQSAGVKNKEEDVTWSERWMESKGVKDVMKNNKLCANIRKRMRFARMLKQKQSQEQGKENNDLQEDILSSLNTVEESSIAQYELIKSIDKLKSNEGDRESEMKETASIEEASTSSAVRNESYEESTSSAVHVGDEESVNDNTYNDVPIVKGRADTNDISEILDD